MISEFSMRIVPKNKNGMLAFLISMSVGIILTVISGGLEAYRGVVGLVGLVFFVVALYLYTRYVVREYYYDITLADGEPLLVVRQLVGKRGTAMCRVGVADIAKVEHLTPELRREHKTPSGYIKYNYTVTMGASDTVALTVNSRYEKCEILLEGGAELAELFDRYSREASAMVLSNDEE